MTAAAQRQNLCLILVSGNGYPPREGPPHVYYRRCRVDSARLDPVFQDCFRRFLSHLERTGQADFRLLEPRPSSAHLVALGLVLGALRSAPGHAAALETLWAQEKALWQRDFWTQAWAEYLGAGGDAGRWHAARLPQSDAAAGLGGVDVPAAWAAVQGALRAQPGRRV
jgi:hypothetical protein